MCVCVGPPDVIVLGSFTVLIGGQELAGGGVQRARRLGLMTAYQDTSLVPDLSVAEARWHPAPARQRVLDWGTMAGPEKTTIEIPDIPSQPLELEDCAAALFQASGHFVERNVVEKDTTEILEMDAVATSYEGDKPTSVIAEAKSGDWGYADLFKIYGWMHYLGIPRGALFVTKMSQGKVLAKIRMIVSAPKAVERNGEDRREEDDIIEPVHENRSVKA